MKTGLSLCTNLARTFFCLREQLVNNRKRTVQNYVGSQAASPEKYTAPHNTTPESYTAPQVAKWEPERSAALPSGEERGGKTTAAEQLQTHGS